MSEEQRGARAVAARALLDDPTVQEAFASIEGELVEEWKRTFEPGERENLWRAVSIMARLQEWLRTAASHDLTALRRQK